MGYLEVRNVILLDYALILSRYRDILEKKKKSDPNRRNPLNSSLDHSKKKKKSSIYNN